MIFSSLARKNGYVMDNEQTQGVFGQCFWRFWNNMSSQGKEFDVRVWEVYEGQRLHDKT